MSNVDLIQNLFKSEFSKIIAVISRKYGLEHIEIAEDIVSDTFLQASESWHANGIPPNPAAWLYAVAKQKTLYHFRRNKILAEKVIPSIKYSMENLMEINDNDFSGPYMRDSMLQMIFAVCNPVIASEAQIGLALRILCGFGIDEIAEAFISNKETINKRLHRAKEKLRNEKVQMELPLEDEMAARLDSVLQVIYLLFNEGYYSTTQNEILRKDLCLEALRLALLLTEDKKTNLSKTNALIALMCFHASRFKARQSVESLSILYEQQDEQLWDNELFNKGVHFLDISIQGSELCSYHLEARIAYWHCIKEDTSEKWEEILDLYDHLLLVNYSPIVALNRIFALYKTKGSKEALVEAEKLNLTNNHFYFTLLGELYSHMDSGKAQFYFQKAYVLSKTDTEKELLKHKIEKI